jgi:hypothetical protein
MKRWGVDKYTLADYINQRLLFAYRADSKGYTLALFHVNTHDPGELQRTILPLVFKRGEIERVENETDLGMITQADPRPVAVSQLEETNNVGEPEGKAGPGRNREARLKVINEAEKVCSRDPHLKGPDIAKTIVGFLPQYAKKFKNPNRTFRKWIQEDLSI